MTGEYLEIIGGEKLAGEIRIAGAKNSVLALLAASILVDDDVISIDDSPDIEDVYIIINILKRLGANVLVAQQGPVKQITIDTKKVSYQEMTFSDLSKLRASYYFIGSMLGKYGRVKIALPGGCFLGARPIDLHIKGLELLGAKVIDSFTPDGEIIEIEAPNGLTGARIFLDIASVGATINLILAASRAVGETIIENAAKEPEIIDLVTMLNNMGAKISGAGTDVIKIKGVKTMTGCYHQVIPDRIEAGTYMMFAAVMGTKVKIKNVIPEHLEGLIAKLIEMGSNIQVLEDSVEITEAKSLKSVNIKTGTYPSFATDLQQVFATVLTQAEGQGKIIETIYSERFKNCEEIAKMGGQFDLISSGVIVTGKRDLVGTDVYTSDLRAGASLILAALIADGKSNIYNIEHIRRGYEDIEIKLQKLGAKIKIKNIKNK